MSPQVPGNIINIPYNHRNIIGRYLAWNWIRDSWDEISTYWDTAISSSVGR